MNLKELGKSSSPYCKHVYMAETKAGKTTWLVASCLGALPHQKESIVSTPADLHIIGVDESFGDGLGDFITDVCKRPDALLGVTVHNLAEARRTSGFSQHNDFTFYNTLMATCDRILAATAKAKAEGRVAAVVISSLTGVSEGLVSGLAGLPTPERKGGGMDLSKWQDLERQIIAFRNKLAVDQHHIFWETHVFQNSKYENNKEIAFEDVDAGKGGGAKNFGRNVEYVFRLRREAAKHEGTLCDKCFVETKPNVMGGTTFLTGRKAHALADRETDLVELLKKLGKKVHGKAL